MGSLETTSTARRNGRGPDTVPLDIRLDSRAASRVVTQYIRGHSELVNFPLCMPLQLLFTVSPFLTFQHVVVNVGNNGMCVCNTAMNIRNSYMYIHRKFGLGMKIQR